MQLRRSQIQRFGITVERYDEMLTAQGGGCAICGERPSGRFANLSIDHDHACCDRSNGCCGKCVRALLCQRCNLMLGKASDQPELLRMAADYLELF